MPQCAPARGAAGRLVHLGRAHLTLLVRRDGGGGGNGGGADEDGWGEDEEEEEPEWLDIDYGEGWGCVGWRGGGNMFWFVCA